VVTCSMFEVLRPEMRGRQVKTGVWQSLARMNLGHEPEVLREVFRAETMQTAIHHDAKFESHSFWHGQLVKRSTVVEHLMLRLHIKLATISKDYDALKRSLTLVKYQVV